MSRSFLFVMALIFTFTSNIFASESLNDKNKNQVLEVFKANEQLHNSFFNYDAKEVEKNAKKLQQMMGKIENDEIKKLLSFSQKKLLEIKSNRGRKENNQSYHLVSMALIHVMNKYDISDSYSAYTCPMVKKKWVQNSKKMSKVHNPYSEKMPHCGSQTK